MQYEPTAPPDKSLAHILIVDDEAAQMKALCDTLRDRGYLSTGFTSGNAALEAMKAQNFDLVLTDLMMPEMDGISLLKSALEIDHNIVGIVMTGEGTIDTAVEAMKTGAIDYILKPFKLSVIMPVLSRALAMHRLRLQNAELEAGIRKRTEELEAANRELETFSYSVSHDLRAPLRHIRGYLEVLREDPDTKLSDSARRCMSAITRSAGHMDRLIEDLLAFSRMGRIEMQRSVFNMGELVRETIIDMESELQGRSIEWDIQPLPDVTADRGMLKQVWLNLLSNAVKYTRTQPQAKISVGAIEKKGEWELQVRDNGVGFDMKDADKLFGVFQRLHDPKEFEGTGLGLANIRRTISRHGGRAWIEARLNEGACFYFTLPAQPVCG